jgi:hypothetical protein
MRLIQARMDLAGICPAYQEIADGLGLKSKNPVHAAVHGLIERGYLKRIPGRARSLQILHRVPTATDPDATGGREESDMPRRPAPIRLAEIDRAIDRAQQGKGNQLASLLKRCSGDDLAAAFSRVGPDLGRALAHIGGRQEMRQEFAAKRALARSRADRADACDFRDRPLRPGHLIPDIPNGFVLVRDDVLTSLADGAPVTKVGPTDAP